MDEGASQMIECPGSCNIVVNDQTVMALVTDPRYFVVILIFFFFSWTA